MSEKYGPLLLRIGIALLFIPIGIGKLMNPSGIQGLLGTIGFKASLAVFFGWIVLLSEIIFGISVLLGWKVKYTIWPLVIILLVALFAVTIPIAGFLNPNSLFHILGILALLALFFKGPGAMALSK